MTKKRLSFIVLTMQRTKRLFIKLAEFKKKAVNLINYFMNYNILLIYKKRGLLNEKVITFNIINLM